MLKQYAAAAGGLSGLPDVVAVDLRAAEPSTAWVARFVSQEQLPFAVGLDASGKVSSAYGVTALPFMAVLSAQGKILWRHVGVLPLPELQAQVKAALAR